MKFLWKSVNQGILTKYMESASDAIRPEGADGEKSGGISTDPNAYRSGLVEKGGRASGDAAESGGMFACDGGSHRFFNRPILHRVAGDRSERR
jgi:hypothetical protein